jgi:hypothetical protein
MYTLLTFLVCMVHVHEARRVHTTNKQALRSVASYRIPNESVGPVTSLANNERELGLFWVGVIGERNRERMPLPPVAGDTSKSAICERGLSREFDDCDALVSNDLYFRFGNLSKIHK